MMMIMVSNATKYLQDLVITPLVLHSTGLLLL
jgi:hypothetical protein